MHAVPTSDLPSSSASSSSSSPVASSVATLSSAIGSLRWAVLAGIALTLIGCCINNVAMELLVRQDPSCGPLVTLLQFVVIALEGLCVHVRVRWPMPSSSSSSGIFGRGWPAVSLLPRRIPMRHYVAMVAIFWLVSVMNNLALGYQIPMPLHMVFRSGSLVTTIALGYALFREHFHGGEVAGAAMVTAGILLATVATQRTRPARVEDAAIGAGLDVGGAADFVVGVLLLSAALILSSLLGIYQTRVAYAAALPGEGKPYRENMFYSHLFSIPLFATFAANLATHAQMWSSSPPLQLPLQPFAVPEMWAYLLLNVASQYVCIRGVFLLTGHLSSLGTTVVVTFRKFVSLVISVLLFRNAWSPLHSFGTVLVFSGAIVYTYGSMQKSKAQAPATPLSLSVASVGSGAASMERR